MRKLTIIFHHAGGGHRSTAEALKATLTTQERPWDVELLNIQDLLGPLDVLGKATGLQIEDAYNLILRKGWTRPTPQLLVLLQSVIRAYHKQIVKSLRNYWAQHPTDLALSVIPHFDREIADSLSGGDQYVPFVTLLTDLADYPPRFWIEPNSEYIIAGTERAKQQAFEMGHPTDHVFEVSGMVLKPKFYEKSSIDRAAERKRHGLEPDCPTGIVLFGGHGSKVMLDIVKRLDRANAAVQLILICGHNKKLAAQLKALRTKKPMLIEGFTSNVEYYMAMADFFIGKPGPGSISEALQLHLPVIVECNARTLPQERYNAQWVTEKGYGIVLNNFKQIAEGVQRLLEPSAFAEFRRRAGTYSNLALLEVPVILDEVFKRAQKGRDRAAAREHASAVQINQ
ncbi:MAG TPA: glycosyltransferase [Terriglobales bacterium]